MASPGLNEITTTTQRNRKMGKDKALASKAIKDVHKSGTHVPEKDFSTAKKEKAAAKGKGGSMTKAASLPMPSAVSTPVTSENKKYEGSGEDWRQDYMGAKKKGITSEEYEDSARDRVEDAAGEKRMRADSDGQKDDKETSNYHKGVSAFSNSPKSAHGFRGQTKDGHHRNSGHPGAHRIGKR